MRNILHIFRKNFKKAIDKRKQVCYNIQVVTGNTLGGHLGVAQLVARYLGVVEAAGSSPVT